MSAEIVQFIPRPKHDPGAAEFSAADFQATDFPAIAFRSARRPDDLAMDHADTAPCEVLASCECVERNDK